MSKVDAAGYALLAMVVGFFIGANVAICPDPKGCTEVSEAVAKEGDDSDRRHEETIEYLERLQKALESGG